MSIAFDNHGTETREELTLRGVYLPEGHLVARIVLEPPVASELLSPALVPIDAESGSNSAPEVSTGTTTTLTDPEGGDGTSTTVPASSAKQKPAIKGLVLGLIERFEVGSTTDDSNEPGAQSSSLTPKESNATSSDAGITSAPTPSSDAPAENECRTIYRLTVTQGFDMALALAIWMAGVDMHWEP
jgi:hypothetical protein